MKLFPDQAEVVNDVRQAMRHHKSLLLVSPTGSGKTAMATHMIESARNKERKIIFMVPRKNLLEQTSETFHNLGIPPSYLAAGKIYNPYSRVYIGMVDTMARRIEQLPKVDLLIPDETHFGENSLNTVIKHYQQQNSWVLGLSATPWKASGKGMGCWYTHMVTGKTVKWLINNNRLSKYKYFHGKTKPDLSKLRVVAGDYAKGEVAEFMEQQNVIIGDCVTDYRNRCMGRIHIVRCASIKHSQMVAESFRSAGIPATHVDGETPLPELKKVFRALATREILVVTFADLLNFGFDLSQASGGLDVCIESQSDLKPSKSLAGQLQFWGRALRWKPDFAIINDHVNNYVEHMFPCTEREWSLADRMQNKRASEERAVPIKQCPACFFVHNPAPACPNCQHVYIVNSREIDQVDGELHEINPDDYRMDDVDPEIMKHEIDKMVRGAVERGVPEWQAVRWAAKKYTEQVRRRRFHAVSA